MTAVMGPWKNYVYNDSFQLKDLTGYFSYRKTSIVIYQPTLIYGKIYKLLKEFLMIYPTVKSASLYLPSSLKFDTLIILRLKTKNIEMKIFIFCDLTCVDSK